MPDPSQIDPRWKKVSIEQFKKDATNIQEEQRPFGGFIGQPTQKDYLEEIEALTERVESLELYIKSIFDGHVLINGQFVKITP